MSPSLLPAPEDRGVVRGRGPGWSVGCSEDEGGAGVDAVGAEAEEGAEGGGADSVEVDGEADALEEVETETETETPPGCPTGELP